MLLAYAIRRTLGALLAFLIVIWLVQFAVWQITEPPAFFGRGGATTLPPFLYPALRLQPDAANEWRAFGVQVGLAVLVLVGGGAAWRMRNTKAK